MTQSRKGAVAARKVTSAGGGIADKLGNRYEGWWTVWRGVLPVLAGGFDSIRVEPPAIDAIEFRLSGRRPAGPDEVHQCKRRHSGSWTVGALQSEGVLQPFGEYAASGVEAVFASGTQSVLSAMANKARRLSVREWSDDLSNPEEKARAELIRIWDVDEREVHDRFRRLTFRVIEEDTLRNAVIERLATTVEGDPETALAVLCAYLDDHLSITLTAAPVWDHLRKKGHGPRSGFDPALSERMRDLTVSYVTHVESARPPSLPWIPRAEVERIVEALRASHGPGTVVVAGAPGAGKSSVVAAVCQALAAHGVVVGPLRLDMAGETPTADHLGRQEGIRFGGPPARILARASAGEPAILVVDQVDAVSALSGRSTATSEALRELLEQARATPNLRLLLACRSEDLRFDGRLRRLLSPDHHGMEEAGTYLGVTVGPLKADQVRLALDRLGLPEQSIPQSLVDLLANPLNLALFAVLCEDTPAAERHSLDLARIRTRMGLFGRYHEHMSQKIRPVLGVNGYSNAVCQLAERMSDSGELSVPRGVLAAQPDTVGVLRHHGVLVEEASRLRFFHEAYFDYVFALHHRSLGRTAADLLQDDPQELLRRGQVRAILTLERSDGPAVYSHDLRAVLGHETRSHVRAAVFDLLAAEDTVSATDLQLLLSIAADTDDPMRRQAVRALSHEPFVRALASNDLLPVAASVVGGSPTHFSALAALVAGLDPNACAYLLFEAARTLPEEAARACLPLASDPQIAQQWIHALLGVVFLAGKGAGAATVDLFCMITQTISAAATGADQRSQPASQGPSPESASDLPSLRALFDSDGQDALNTVVRNAPAHAPRAIGAWLAAGNAIGLTLGATSVFDQPGPLAGQPTGLDIFESCAKEAPADFANAVVPLYLEDLERTARNIRWNPAGERETEPRGLRYSSLLLSPSEHTLKGEIHHALCQALRLGAAQDADRIAPLVAQLQATDLLTAHQLVSTAYADAAPALLDDALVWAADPRMQGLPSGATTGWAWGEVLAHIAATGTPEQRDRAVALATDSYENLDLHLLDEGDTTESDNTTEAERGAATRHAARAQHVTLTLLTKALGAETPSAVRERIGHLEERLGPAPAQPMLEPLVWDFPNRHPGEPTSDLDDEQWLNKVDDASRGHDPKTYDPFEDKIHGLAQRLEEAAKERPGRFARLLQRFQPTVAAPLVVAVLRGLTAASETPEPAEENGLFDAIRSAFARQPVLEVDLEICRLVHHLASRDLPADIVTLVTEIGSSTRNPSPQSWTSSHGDVASSGLSHPRGLALNTMAELIAYPDTRTERIQLLRPALETVVADPAEQIRVWLPQVLVRVHLADPQLAADLGQRWAAGATEACLIAPDLDRFIWQLALTHPASAAELLRRMVESPDDDARNRAGKLVALLSVRGIDLPAFDNPPALARALGDPASRKGVADFLAQLVDELPDGPASRDGAPRVPDRRLLIQLLSDDDPEVRDVAATFARYMNQSLDTYSSLIGEAATSKAFQEHPAHLLHALHSRTSERPATVLDVCKQWIDHHHEGAGDIRTAYYVVDLVLALYTQSPPGSPERIRCLDILDRLIEAGAANASAKADEAIYDPTRATT